MVGSATLGWGTVYILCSSLLWFMCLVDLTGMFFLVAVVLPAAIVVWTIVIWRILLKMAGAKVRAVKNDLKSDFRDVLIGEN